MADFRKAFERTADNEGGYVNDPTDAGGETWKGIARKKHPFWKGWEIVDIYVPIKKTVEGTSDEAKRITKLLNGVADLFDHVLAFYKPIFWDKIKGDDINIQAVADIIYDSAVLTGPTNAIKQAQRAAGMAESGNMTKELLKHLNNEV